MALRAEPRAIVFDFDGVLVESLEIKTEAFRTLFADHPEHLDRIVQLHLDKLGVSRYEKFKTIYRELLHRPLSDAEMGRLDRRFSELVYERVLACELVHGARELLEWAAAEHRLYVASATPQPELVRIVQARGLSRWFAAVRGSPQSKAEIVAEILAEDHLRPEQLVFVGDARSDLAAAREHGVPFIGRVPPGNDDPFGGLGIPTVGDLAELQQRWDELLDRAAARSWAT
ncbi:MAG: HAD family hydrolase [Solirubrobacterales bacterium]|nr:HAD family hydrolase [Solirubrobacterales bacterium]MBV9472720.1 HAD family hydrolase [Solirubrobacterales bacterium]